MRSPLRSFRVAEAALVVLVLTGRHAAQETDRGSPSPVVEAVTASLDVERTILKEDMEHRERLATERARVTLRLGDLYTELDAALKRGDRDLAKTLEEIREKVGGTEIQRTGLLAEERAVLDRIQDRFRRIRLLEDRLAALEERVQELNEIIPRAKLNLDIVSNRERLEDALRGLAEKEQDLRVGLTFVELDEKLVRP